ncbi:PLP-dependent aminotransferase family protein [Vibrio viridaestus]|uniref:PLP-dependent aminotransferase family protein n=1 Tax=Vibrio viridaestus TaxID=2487322 RepID=A0A3N9TJD1_9VIBR|nr:PLP-dependent aminotransferase family protein [Vibrio viridaestus]RQW64419.1 PLP-dependent aminotransferase family protein [Vibrio viridaestus]
MSESKFEKIASVIEKRITNGDYPPNFKLPTHKELAEDLDTTPATVSKAYKLLIDRKKIESFVGRGTFVCGHSSLSQAIHPNDNSREINLSILQPCMNENAIALSAAMQACANSLTPELMGYAENSGHEVHRNAGVLWAKNYGLEGGSAENTLLVDGAQNALALAIIALSKPGDVIAVEALTYPGILAAASLYRRTIIPVAMDDDGMRPDELEKVIRDSNPAMVVVVPSHQNPTAVTMSEERRAKIAAVIKNSQCLLIEDDIYAFLNETPLPAISNWVDDRAVHISSLSKAISPALRCGFVKAPDPLLATLKSHIRTNIWLSSPFNYAVANELISSGEAFNMAKTQRKIAIERQEIVRKYFPYITGGKSSFHCWLMLPENWTSERFSLVAKDRNVVVSSGTYFNSVGVDTKSVRVSLMSASTNEQLETGLKVLHELVHSDVNTLFPF